MGSCLSSKPFLTFAKPATTTQKMQPLARPACYEGKGPSLYAAYARAARRYGFEAGRNGGFAKRNNVVVRVKSKHNKDTDHEVPAESIQNGRFRLTCSCRISPAQLTLFEPSPFRVSLSHRT